MINVPLSTLVYCLHIHPFTTREQRRQGPITVRSSLEQRVANVQTEAWGWVEGSVAAAGIGMRVCDGIGVKFSTQFECPF